MTNPDHGANRRGDPCPEWCTQDHHTPDHLDHHRGETARIPLSGDPSQRAAQRAFGKDARWTTVATAGPILIESGYDPRVEIKVDSHTRARLWWLSPDQATDVAELLEKLAYASPAQMQRIVKGIRETVALTAVTAVPKEITAGPTETDK